MAVHRLLRRQTSLTWLLPCFPQWEFLQSLPMWSEPPVFAFQNSPSPGRVSVVTLSHPMGFVCRTEVLAHSPSPALQPLWGCTPEVAGMVLWSSPQLPCQPVGQELPSPASLHPGRTDTIPMGTAEKLFRTELRLPCAAGEPRMPLLPAAHPALQPPNAPLPAGLPLTMATHSACLLFSLCGLKLFLCPTTAIWRQPVTPISPIQKQTKPGLLSIHHGTVSGALGLARVLKLLKEEGSVRAGS